MKIRHVADEDADKIVEYAQDFMSYYPFDIEYDLFDLIRVLETISNQGIFLVAEEDGEVIGAIGGLITPHFYAPKHKIASELFLWVEDSARKSGVGPLLLSEFEQIAEEKGCTYISMTSTVHTPDFKSYLKGQHYREVETSFMKEIV